MKGRLKLKRRGRLRIRGINNKPRGGIQKGDKERNLIGSRGDWRSRREYRSRKRRRRRRSCRRKRRRRRGRRLKIRRESRRNRRKREKRKKGIKKKGIDQPRQLGTTRLLERNPRLQLIRRNQDGSNLEINCFDILYYFKMMIDKHNIYLSNVN